MSYEKEHSLFCPGTRIKLLEIILSPNTVGRICSNGGWYLWLWYSSACCLHPWQSKSFICTIQSVNAPSPWLYFYILCINQTSTILSSESNYDPLSLNLSLWQEEAGNTVGKPSNWDQNLSSRKMWSPMWQWERMARKEKRHTDPTPNSWNYSEHAIQVCRGTKHQPSSETLITFSSNFLFWAHRVSHRQAISNLALFTASSWKAERIVPMKVFIQISVRYFYTVSESFIQLFLPVSLYWNQLQKCKIWLQYHMQKLMVNNILTLTRCLVRSHRVLDEAIQFLSAYTELSYQRKSECFFTQPCKPAATSTQPSLHQRHCDNKKIQKKWENEYMAEGWIFLLALASECGWLPQLLLLWVLFLSSSLS